MEKREDALREALEKNEKEVDRWIHYKNENNTAIENLDKFRKSLMVDVMVAIGRKAYIPGQLIHTNEVLVGHYQGYFSKCSAHKAKEICEMRLRAAEDHLKKLQVEADLWHGKLMKPYSEGVLPTAEEMEIIEDYDEEKEKQWRNEHRLRIKESKVRERQEREAFEQQQRNDSGRSSENVDILSKLEGLELMEELEKELEGLKVNDKNDETLRKLMSGELQLPPQKHRIAHNAKETSEDEIVLDMKQQNIIKKSELKSHTIATNNNCRPNPDMNAVDSDMSSDSETDRVQDEVQIIKKQAEYLPVFDQIGFYEYQIQILKTKMFSMPIRDKQGVDEKIRLASVLDCLEEELELVEEAVGPLELESSTEENPKSDTEYSGNKSDSTIKAQNGKRRISFALEDQTVEFRRNEAVALMIPKNEGEFNSKEIPQHDVISLNELENEKPSNDVFQKRVNTLEDKKQSILNKVEQNTKYFAERQSEQDTDLVNKIIQSSADFGKTLHIGFRHSEQKTQIEIDENVTILSPSDNANFMPITPADFYIQYLKNTMPLQPATIFVNAYDGEEQVKVPVLREVNKEQAYCDPKREFFRTSNLSIDEISTKNTTDNKKKSILRNKHAVQSEQHNLVNCNSENQLQSTSNIIKKKKKTNSRLGYTDETEYMSAYDKVMNDVVEKPITEPEPLPEGKFIDAHTPKKRVSRFKTMRIDAKNT